MWQFKWHSAGVLVLWIEQAYFSNAKKHRRCRRRSRTHCSRSDNIHLNTWWIRPRPRARPGRLAQAALTASTARNLHKYLATCLPGEQKRDHKCLPSTPSGWEARENLSFSFFLFLFLFLALAARSTLCSICFTVSHLTIKISFTEKIHLLSIGGFKNRCQSERKASAQVSCWRNWPTDLLHPNDPKSSSSNSQLTKLHFKLNR